MMIATFLICIGLNACSMATNEHCAIALGDDVQLPPHASHVLATNAGTRPITRIDRELEGMINREIMRLGGQSLSHHYVDHWNLICAPPVARLIS